MLLFLAYLLRFSSSIVLLLRWAMCSFSCQCFVVYDGVWVWMDREKDEEAQDDLPWLRRRHMPLPHHHLAPPREGAPRCKEGGTTQVCNTGSKPAALFKVTTVRGAMWCVHQLRGCSPLQCDPCSWCARCLPPPMIQDVFSMFSLFSTTGFAAQHSMGWGAWAYRSAM